MSHGNVIVKKKKSVSKWRTKNLIIIKHKIIIKVKKKVRFWSINITYIFGGEKNRKTLFSRTKIKLIGYVCK